VIKDREQHKMCRFSYVLLRLDSVVVCVAAPVTHFQVNRL